MAEILHRVGQSVYDLCLQAYGTLDQLVKFCQDNGVTDMQNIPQQVPYTFDETLVLYQGNAEIFATEYTPPYVPPPPLAATVVLYPKMAYTPQTTGNPHTVGNWIYSLSGDGFISAYDLLDSYPTACQVIALTEDAYVAGGGAGSAVTVSPSSLPPMSDMEVRWRVNYNNPPQGFGYLMVWSNVSSESTPTLTYIDVNDNRAHVSPLLVIDNLSQDLVAYLLADVAIETVSATGTEVVVRVTRTHPSTVLADFANHTMSWKGTMAAMLTDDPDNPGNPDIQIATLTPGTYGIGVRTVYHLTSPAMDYPPSEFTAVVEVG